MSLSISWKAHKSVIPMLQNDLIILIKWFQAAIPETVLPKSITSPRLLSNAPPISIILSRPSEKIAMEKAAKESQIRKPESVVVPGTTTESNRVVDLFCLLLLVFGVLHH